ncbi:MAG: nucleotidyltransferase family protein [Actinomycetia bacterium]|nr:nucleotidyltransferase family protein [Actinomycetes bacterium]
MLGKSDILETLRQSKGELCDRYKVKEIGLFGSFARADEYEASDIDILVEFNEGADLFDFVALGDFLEERLGRKVDLVTRRAIRPEMRDTIAEEVSMV